MSRAPRDHPRSRGVYCSTSHFGSRIVGSSPLARGLLLLLAHIRVILGIIPARAGFTNVVWYGSDEAWDHPRSRGVYFLDDFRTQISIGSSPLARGLPPISVRRITSAGIIPARAGFTRRILSFSLPRRDHPRSRGVYHIHLFWDDFSLGSSPLARGLRTGTRARRRR